MASKIIHVIKIIRIAGAESHLLDLLSGLRADGVDAEMLVLVEPGNPMAGLLASANARGIPTHRMTIRADLDPGLLGRLRRFFKMGGYDLVHTHLIHADLYGMMAARRAGVPRVVSTRHNDNPFRRWLPIRLLHRELWRRTDHGIAISDWIRRFCIEVEGAPTAKVSTVHYGLDPASVRTGDGARAVLRTELGVKRDAPLVGTICRLIPQKGIEHALRAFWQLAEAMPTVHFAVAGEGPLRGEFESMIQGLGLAGRVHFLGWRDDPHAVIAALDVLLVPSLWEGFGLVSLEAMAQSIPIIASRVSAIPEIIVNGETGLLVPPGDVESLASAMSTLLADRHLAREMGQKGRGRLDACFSVTRMIEGTRAVYRALDIY